jgi:signal transduction histidine kinase
MRTRLRLVAFNLGLAVVYLLAARLGFAFDPVSGFATGIWPPTGIALAAVLLFGNRLAFGVFLGAFGANLLAGAPLAVAIGIAAGNTGEALIGATLLRRVPGFSITLERVSSVVGLIVLSALLSTLVSATVGVVSLYVGGLVQPPHIRGAWRAWWVGDMVGSLLIAPIILVWSTPARARREVHRMETVALVAVLAVVSAMTFFSELPYVPTLPTPFHQVDLLVAVLLWATFRFGQRGATTAVLCVSVAAVVATALRYGPFALPELSESLMFLQTFVAIVAATCLLFGATVAERRIANQDAGRARLAAEAANRAKSQFLAVMSHELRTPLNAIQGFAELLLETGVYGPLNEKQTDAVKRIEKNEKDLLSLINEVLGFVNAEKQPVTSEFKDVLLEELFDAVEPLIAPDVERKHLVVVRELARPGLAVRADPKQLEPILGSLLSNASKYTGDGGTITLGADAQGGKVRIWVRDTGIGIKKDEMERVFEPFFQADSGTTRQYSGIGLGLTIARDLARRMAGEVTIASEAGTGTTASLVLPAANEAGGETTVTEVRPAA